MKFVVCMPYLGKNNWILKMGVVVFLLLLSQSFS